MQRDDDVVERLNRQRPEHRVQRPAPAVDKDDFIGFCVAKQLRLRLRGPAVRQGHVVIHQERHASADRIALRLELPALEVMMAQHLLRHDIARHLAGRLDLDDARRRPQMVADRVRPAEAAGGNDFLVVDALAVMPAFAAMGDVAFAREGAALEIGRHDLVHPVYVFQPGYSAEVLCIPRGEGRIHGKHDCSDKQVRSADFPETLRRS